MKSESYKKVIESVEELTNDKSISTVEYAGYLLDLKEEINVLIESLDESIWQKVYELP